MLKNTTNPKSEAAATTKQTGHRRGGGCIAAAAKNEKKKKDYEKSTTATGDFCGADEASRNYISSTNTTVEKAEGKEKVKEEFSLQPPLSPAPSRLSSSAAAESTSPQSRRHVRVDATNFATFSTLPTSTKTTGKRVVHYDIMSSASGESSCSSGRHSPFDLSSTSGLVVGGNDQSHHRNSTTTAAIKQQQQQQRSSISNSITNTISIAAAAKRRLRTVSGSMVEDPFLRWKGKVVYTAGRPSWFDCHGAPLHEPFIIGICGGSASGKTTVAERIIAALDVQWVTLLSMDSFYKVLNDEQHEKAAQNLYNFDHPDAFDFELLRATIQRLREGKCVQVPIYNFTTHSREKTHRTMYGASVLIFEGILAFHMADIVDLMDLKVFVDTDSDTRLARRLQRDVAERGRGVEGVLDQYDRFVKPAFDSFIAPTMRHADIIIPRGGENYVAIDLIVRHVKTRLTERECSNRAKLAMCGKGDYGGGLANNSSSPSAVPPTLHVLPQTPQVRGLHTFIRNRTTPRDEFMFYSSRLMRLLLEFALSFMPFVEDRLQLVLDNTTPQQPSSPDYYAGKKRADKICGISILRAGETMEPSLREVVKDCIIGKILIQTNPGTKEPELYYVRLPKDVHTYQVFLLDATVATGAAAIMAIRILLDHDVRQENISLVSLLMAETGVHSVAYAFPNLRIITTAVDKELSENYHILPGIGNFGDRYFGTATEAEFNGNRKGKAKKRPAEKFDSVFDSSGEANEEEEEEDLEEEEEEEDINGDAESGISAGSKKS